MSGLTYHSTVLILVLMEDTLRVYLIITIHILWSLNPCFNGRYSQRSGAISDSIKEES